MKSLKYLKSNVDMKICDKKDEEYNYIAMFLFSIAVGYITGKIVEFILTII